MGERVEFRMPLVSPFDSVHAQDPSLAVAGGAEKVT